MSQNIERHGNWEYWTDDSGKPWKRRVQLGEWRPVSPPPKPMDPVKCLWLVLHAQAEGEPKHWSLFVGEENQSGAQYQVTGDATFMEHKFAQDVNVWTYTDYLTSYSLGQLDENGEDEVKRCAEAETPPRAENRAEVKEHCQGWTVRVIRSLTEKGVVDKKAVKVAEDLLEPI